MITGVAATLPDPGTEWWRADRLALIEQLQTLEVLQRQAAAVQGEILAEISSREALAEYGYGSPQALLRDTLRLDRREATRRISRATACNPVRGALGDKPALAPAAGQAFRLGGIGHGQLDAIGETMAELPGWVTDSDRRDSEAKLLALAESRTAPALRQAGRHIVNSFDQDGTPPPEGDRELTRPERELRLSWRRDGRLGLTGTLDAEAGKALESVLSPLAQPQPAEGDTRDERDPAQRRALAAARRGLCLPRLHPIQAVVPGASPRTLGPRRAERHTESRSTVYGTPSADPPLRVGDPHGNGRSSALDPAVLVGARVATRGTEAAGTAAANGAGGYLRGCTPANRSRSVIVYSPGFRLGSSGRQLGSCER
nr:DUF222 domain-containing protein [Haloechinothrix sp. LS1_15]